MTAALALVAAYLVGGIPFGYLLVKLRTGRDVRAFGSGNIGATNVLRTSGRGAGILTLALDIAKGFFAVWLAARLTGDLRWTAAAAVAVILGHAFPVFLRFRGGKAVASFTGAFLYLAPWALLGVGLLFVLAVGLSRYISLGSILGALVFPFAVWWIYGGGPMLLAALFGGIFIVWRHRGNIERLRRGRENRFSFGGSAR